MGQSSDMIRVLSSEKGNRWMTLNITPIKYTEVFSRSLFFYVDFLSQYVTSIVDLRSFNI